MLGFKHGSDHTRNISLTPELDQYVETQILSGTYTSASEVVREGLRRLQSERRQEDMLLLAALGLDPKVDLETYDRADLQGRLDDCIQPALDQLRRGKGIPVTRCLPSCDHD